MEVLSRDAAVMNLSDASQGLHVQQINLGPHTPHPNY